MASKTSKIAKVNMHIKVWHSGEWSEQWIGWNKLDINTWSDNKVRELIAVKVLHISLLNITVAAFKVPPLGRFVLMPVPSPPLKKILELALWNGLQSCHRITPDVINVIKMLSFQYFLYLWEQ
jgi:hypothetical protein